MVLKDYFMIIKNRFWLLVIIALVAVLTTYIFTLKKSDVYEASASILVTKKLQSNTSDYQFDQYYAIQASSLYADTIANLFKDPTNIIDIYNKANLQLPTDKTKSLPKLISTKRIPPLTIVVSLTDKDQDVARALITRSMDFVRTTTNNWAREKVNSDFALTFNEPLISKANRNITTNTILGFLVGIVIGLATVFGAEFFGRESKK